MNTRAPVLKLQPVFLAVLLVAGCGDGADLDDGGRDVSVRGNGGTSFAGSGGSSLAGTGGSVDAGTGDDGAVSGGCGMLGRACTSNVDCGVDGRCIMSGTHGICAILATAACSAPGSSAECPAGARCWTSTSSASICYPDCIDGCGCDSEHGVCDSDLSCAPRTQAKVCNCSCTCSSCTGTSKRTCANPSSSSCSSCTTVCRDLCSNNGGCGSYVSGSGTCS